MTSPKDVRNLLNFVEFLTPRRRKFFLKTLSKKQMALFEVACFNLATNPDSLSTKELSLLKKYKRQIETVAIKHYSLTDKRKIISQRGGFLPAVLPILGTLISSLLIR